MRSATFSCLLFILSLIYCSRLTQGKAIYGAFDENIKNEIGKLIKKEVRDSTSTTKPLLDDTNSNVKAISTSLNAENSSSEISTLTENEDNTTSITEPPPNDIIGKAINAAINIKNKIIDVSTPILNDIRNSTSNSTIPFVPDSVIGMAINTTINIKNKIIDVSTPILNDIRNSTSNSTIPFVPDSVIEALPMWAWIVLGILLTLVLCCICCCRHILLIILKCPFYCVYKVLYYPLYCCWSCIGFDQIGVRAGSLAAGFQSVCYGGYTPSGSCFSCLQSLSMK